MGFLAGLFWAVVVLAAGSLVWQHLRYLRTRRSVVHDRQPLFYGSSVFHVVSFVELEPGSDLFESVGKLRDQLETAEGVRLVYAGKTVLQPQMSAQIGEVAWDAVVLVQYPSASAYEELAGSPSHREAFARFARSYSCGLQRSAAQNVLIPLVLLGRRLRQIVTRQPSNFPFDPAPNANANVDDGRLRAFEALGKERELGSRAIVIVNLIKQGTPEQRAADRAYTGRMFSAMAEGAYGPMHIGRAERLEGTADFDAVALVYYPGVDFFMSMVRSTFFQGIIGGKQLGDTQVTITVPMLSRL